MIGEPDPSAGSDNVEAPEDAELGRALEAYLADIEAGRPADPARLITAHPKIAGQLRACLQVMNLADRMISSASSSGSGMHRPIARLDPTTTAPGQSGLTTLGSGSVPNVHLRDLPDEWEPLIQPRSTEMPVPNGTSLGRYQLQGEIARGGMGAILKGRDVDLGRDLALKVLLEAHEGNPEVVSRFIEEAQIGGQLQHPGIAPVYELGTFPDPDRRPYFAMKLVRGQTLAALLAERKDRAVRGSPDRAVRGSPDCAGRGSPDCAGRGSPDPALQIRAGRGSPDPALPATEGFPPAPDDLHRFLAIFEQVCQTMAYAHARGVIHRDLKPSNVMVGSFGEVQVMDWGLAKVLPRGGIADEGSVQTVQETVVMTVRSGSSASGGESQAGSVLGTPSYMAPEQARGEMERVDERADAFGLGAILCEILAGRPPFVGLTREEIRGKAARGELAEALSRLDASGADAELIGLARSCLAVAPEARPRNASEVTRQLTAYLAGVQDRLRAAELARVEAQARAAEERTRRRLTMALAASILVTAGLAGGGWAFLARQRLERAAIFNQAVGEAEALYSEAKRAGDDLARWHTAREAAHAVERLRADAPGESSRRRASEFVGAVTLAATATENDQKLLARLAEIRSGMADDPDGSIADADYEYAFREGGLEIAGTPPADVAAKIQVRPPATQVSLAAALDEWAAVRRHREGQSGARTVTAVSRMADPDPWRNRLRELLQTPASAIRLKSLQDLARSARVEELSAESTLLLGETLLETGDLAGAEAVLREGQLRYPGDVWLNVAFARCLERLARHEEAIRYFTAAQSLQPETAHELAHALETKGESEQAIAVFQRLRRLRPENGRHLYCLAVALRARGLIDESYAVLDASIAALRAGIRRWPLSASIHGALGAALSDQGKLDDAIAEYHAALRIKPDYAFAHSSLGNTLREQGKLDEAIAELRAAIRIKPDYAFAHSSLGNTLREQGKLDEAIAELRAAIRIKPDFAEAHASLGGALVNQGKLDEAIAEYGTAIRFRPGFSEAHSNLGNALRDQGKLDEAIAEYRTAIRIKPDLSIAHYNLGNALRGQGKLDEAIAEYYAALRIKPDYADAHTNLGNALRDQGKLDEAIAELRAALRIKPDFAEARSNLGGALSEQGKLDEAIAELRAALRIKPGLSLAHYNLGNALKDQGKLDEAIAEYRTAIRIKPDSSIAHHNLGLALRDQGKLDEAIAEYYAALRIKPEYADAHTDLGNALRDQGKLDEALAEYHAALRIKPDSAVPHFNLGNTLREQGKLDEAIAEYRTAIRIKPDFSEPHYNLGNALNAQGKRDEAVAEFRTAIRIKPDHAEAHCNLGQEFCHQGRFLEGLAELKRGHELGSKSPNWRYPSADWVRYAELLVDLDRRLPAILSGREKPADAAESLALAVMCYNKKLHAASARFWTEAFHAQPKVADDMNVQNRYNAACAAALAGSGQGKDDPPLDGEKKTHWRKQAIDWLKADVTAWSKILDSAPPQTKQAITQTLQHWKADTDLAGLRDATSLAKLPEDEQKACRALWAEVDALLAKSGNPKAN